MLLNAGRILHRHCAKTPIKGSERTVRVGDTTTHSNLWKAVDLKVSELLALVWFIVRSCSGDPEWDSEV